MTGAERHAAASIREATVDDIREIRSILAEHGNDGPITTVDVVGPYIRHLVTTARALVVVDGGQVVAFGSAVDTGGGGRHLTDLFVRKDRVGHGIGRTLLDEVFAGTTRRTTFASDDPRAMPLYIRAGMSPLWPCLYLTGEAPTLADADRGLVAETADAARLAGLERDWTGVDRSVDHAFWATQAEADPFVIMDGGEIVAGGYGRARQKGPSRFLDRLVIRPGQDPLAPIYAALRRAARGGRIDAAIPGPNPAVRPLLEAGFRIDDRDTFMASGPDLVDPTRLLPNPGML
jgi:GNAT superfamily N-acetyltransferase